MAQRERREEPKRPPVTIKGVRNRLVFYLDDACAFGDILADLDEKLNGAQARLLSGAQMDVSVYTGSRDLSEWERDEVRRALSRTGSLLVREFVSDRGRRRVTYEPRLVYGPVRAGQVVVHPGDLVVIGDVNPGGLVAAEGDVYVLGALRGIAHAGSSGDREAVIAAADFRPTQIRIADIISEPPEERVPGVAYFEYAYIDGDRVQVDKLWALNGRRPRRRSGEGTRGREEER
ncbi:septum site-determining protein MinC [Kyrpidia spormannii]|uniref:Septum site-determining protein MinC n=3 Tax=Kyrpidia spormannii TaxID=2055160 RepID=A0ACA8Z8Y6_9BACL|nr:septum site-determining protein MinC [Kyrpidia spormannii]CAB3391010.1 putative septum site-determining protein MinC [Kyrpidia spormannii]CAB3391919.1 putative septum site-determining protein MinC [Kyrpidia spormannii]